MTHRLATLVLLGASLISFAATAQDAPANASPAQSAAAPSLANQQAAPQPGLQNPSQNATLYHAAPVVRLFGLPEQLRIDAPVDPSYAPTAYRTLGGQAETSADAVAEQSTTWH